LPILSNLQDFLEAVKTTSGRRLGLIALDVSKRAIGVAGADPDWRLATPLLTVKRTKLAKDMERLESVLREREAGALVIGLPFNMDGTEGPRCQAIRQFAADLDRSVNVPTLLWDERLTTFDAEERAEEMGLKGQKRADFVDAIAASVILEDVLHACG
jgi:putative Holliday junction resolvase